MVSGQGNPGEQMIRIRLEDATSGNIPGIGTRAGSQTQAGRAGMPVRIPGGAASGAAGAAEQSV